MGTFVEMHGEHGPMGLSQSFDLVAVSRALAGTRFARRVHHFATIDSTNTQLLADAAEGALDSTVYLAEEQMAGRGRGGHEWHSAPGDGLYLSVLVRSPLPIAKALWISLAAGIAAADAISAVAGLRADIRWPNDLLIQTPKGSRKCGGILVETAVEGEVLRYAVIGIGINLNHTKLPEELEDIATSLRIEAGARIYREALFVDLLRNLDLELSKLEAAQGDLLARFAERSSWASGKRVRVAEAGGYTGVTAGLDEQGFLQVITDDGSQRSVLSGGVREA